MSGDLKKTGGEKGINTPRGARISDSTALELLTELTQAAESRGSDAGCRPTIPPPRSWTDPKRRGSKRGD